MKTSRRYLTGTLVVLLILPVFAVAYSRFAGNGTTRPLPERTPAAELAQLRDFTAIRADGDFALEISAAADYSVVYEPLADARGGFVARIEDGTLVLSGFGNRVEPGERARVRVTAPNLTALDIGFTRSLTISALNVAGLELNLRNVGSVTLRDSTIGRLRLQGNGNLEDVTFERNTVATTEIRTLGSTHITINE